MDVMVLEGVVLLPGTMVPLNIFEPRYKNMLNHSIHGNRTFALCNAVEGRPARYFGLGIIKTSILNADGTYQLILEGVYRYRIERVISQDPLLQVVAEKVEAKSSSASDGRAREQVEKYIRLLADKYPRAERSLTNLLDSSLDDGAFADQAAGLLVADSGLKQKLLETLSAEKRLTLLHQFLDTSGLDA